MKKNYAIKSGKHDGKQLTITIVENVQEMNIFDGSGRVVLPTPQTNFIAHSGRKGLSNILSFFMVMAFVALCIFGLITYISLDGSFVLTEEDSVRPVNGQKSGDSSGLLKLASPESAKPIALDQSCYGLMLPYPIQKTSQRGTCSVHISLSNPKGFITIDHRLKESQTISPDVSMRKSRSDLYSESTSSHEDYNYITFTKKDALGYEKTAFLDVGHSWISITLKTEIASEDRDSKFESMLGSFYCKKECLP
jgi:hypothetical protein